MKKIVLALAVLAVSGTVSYAQCDKKVLLTSSKTEFLGTDSTVQRSEDETTTITYDKVNITVAPGNHTMTGTISSTECAWTVPFKTGKTVIKALLTGGGDGQTEKVTITIEGKDGKISFHATQDDHAGRIIRLTVGQFEEDKR